MENKTDAIRRLNDEHRSTLHAETYITSGVSALGPNAVDDILQSVMHFDDFSEVNDPYGEHDFGSLSHDGDTIYWKIGLL